MNGNIYNSINRLKDIHSKIVASHPIPEDSVNILQELITYFNVLSEIGVTGDHLLDIGCGGMEKTAFFSSIGFDCYGCDDFSDPWHLEGNILEKLIRFAKVNNIKLHSQMEEYELPWPEKFFEIVVILSVIEHLHDTPRNLLNFAGKYLKSGGYLVVSMPNSVNLRKRIHVLLGKTNYPPIKDFYNSDPPWRGHVREYTMNETVYILEQNNFVVERCLYFNAFSWKLTTAVVRKIYDLLCKICPSLSDSFLIVSKKSGSWHPA